MGQFKGYVWRKIYGSFYRKGGSYAKGIDLYKLFKTIKRLLK